MELQLGLALSTANTHIDNNGVGKTESSNTIARKRPRFSVEDDQPTNPQTLPLLQSSGKLGGDDDEDDNCSVVLDKEGEGGGGGGEDGIVGWPPINYRREKKKIRNQRDQMVGGGGFNRSSYSSSEEGECGAGNSTMYVKATMDGVGIGRKVDLALHDSFASLRRQLFGMFGLAEEDTLDGGAGEYQLTYQDADGDWLLADDISWRSFIGSVQRVRLMRSSISGSS